MAAIAIAMAAPVFSRIVSGEVGYFSAAKAFRTFGDL